MDQTRLTKQIFRKIWKYNIVADFVKQIKDDIKHFITNDKDCVHRVNYGKKIYCIQVWRNKKIKKGRK